VNRSPNTNARLAKGADPRPTNGKKADNPNNSYGSMLEVETAGAPPLDWHTDDLDGDWLWKLATAPYAGSHYATYPLALPRRLVLAMCPLQVCTVCGWPRERVTGEATYVDSNVDLVRRRLAENVRIVSEHHDGDTVTWTVEQVTRSELVADAGGQMDLFAS
jgi:hypothetical protein